MHTPYKRGCVETRRGARGGEKPARASAGIACPSTTAHCQSALSVCHFCQCLHIFTTHGWTCGQYIELFCMLFNSFFMMSSSMYSPKLFFSHIHTTYYLWTSSMSLWPFIVHCCIARPCVNMTHFIHFLLVRQVSYSPFADVIKNTAISILKWASPCETSLGHYFPKYVSLTWRA